MNENWRQLVPTLDNWLADAASQLAAAGIPSARLDSELLLCHTLRKNRSYLRAHGDEPLSARDDEIADARLSLRLDRVPVAYIIGHKEFYGHSYHVSTATLIPRPESEALIELLRKIMPSNLSLLPEKLRLADVGTGSGILGITAKLLYPELDVSLIDVSRHALKVAAKNAGSLNADVTTIHGDLLAEYPFQADIILANLPYVDPAWERSPETNHEPVVALFAHDGGKALIHQLVIQTKQKLRPGGWLILEADPSQHHAIVQDAKQYGLRLADFEGYGLVLKKEAS